MYTIQLRKSTIQLPVANESQGLWNEGILNRSLFIWSIFCYIFFLHYNPPQFIVIFPLIQYIFKIFMSIRKLLQFRLLLVSHQLLILINNLPHYQPFLQHNSPSHSNVLHILILNQYIILFVNTSPIFISLIYIFYLYTLTIQNTVSQYHSTFKQIVTVFIKYETIIRYT